MPRNFLRQVGTSRVAPIAVGRLPEHAVGFRGGHSLFFSLFFGGSASRNRGTSSGREPVFACGSGRVAGAPRCAILTTPFVPSRPRLSLSRVGERVSNGLAPWGAT